LLDLERNRYFGLAPAAEQTYEILLFSAGVRVERTLSARELLVDAVNPDAVRMSVLDITRFARAWLHSAWMFRRWSLLRIVQRLGTRRANAGQQPLDVARTRRLMSVFFRLRAFAYTKKGRCLLDTLVLVEFLALHGMFPTFVIGVKTQPFAAHSWAQWDGYVLNGTPEYVRRFTPILSI
jgi:hypothetical protein